MGNSASGQGSSNGAHDRDLRSSDSDQQHDWQLEQAEAAEPEPQSLQETRKSYNGAQRAARKSPEDRNKKSSVMNDDSSSSGDERDDVQAPQRRHQSPRSHRKPPSPQTESSSSDKDQQRRSSRRRKKTRSIVPTCVKVATWMTSSKENRKETTPVMCLHLMLGLISPHRFHKLGVTQSNRPNIADRKFLEI